MKSLHRPEEPLADVYSSIPLGFARDIPVFSEADEYTDNYEKIAKDHIAFLNGDTRINFPPEYFVRQTESSTASLLRKYAEPGMKILDVGVSRGYLLSYFPDLDRYGLDISLDYLEVARARGIQVCYSRIEDMPYRKEVFDLVVCTDVLEHVVDLNLCCRQLISVLKPTGVLIVRVPHLEDLSAYLAPSFPYKYVHLRTFDIPSLQLLFEKILACTVKEMVLAGYFSDERRRKNRVPFPNMDYVLARLSAVPEEDRPMICEAVLQNWYEATAINAVIVKGQTLVPPTVEWTEIGRAPRITENKLNDETTRSALERQLISELHHNSEMTAQLAGAQEALENAETRLREMQNAQMAGAQALENAETRLREVQNTLRDTEEGLVATKQRLEDTERCLRELEDPQRETDERLALTQLRLEGSETRLREAENTQRDTEERLAVTRRRLEGSETCRRESENAQREIEEELAVSRRRCESCESRLREVENTQRDTETQLAVTRRKLETTERRLCELQNAPIFAKIAETAGRKWRAWKGPK